MTALPHSPEAENIVIGCIAEYPGTWPTVAAEVSATDFVNRMARKAFELATEIDRRGEPVDGHTISLAAYAASDPEVAHYVQEAARAVLGPSNIRAYCNVLREKRTERAMVFLATKIRELATDTKPILDRIEEVQKTAMALTQNQSENIVEAAPAYRTLLHDLVSRNGRAMVGFSTGYPSLDSRWGGIRRGGLHIVAGRPAMGKTTLALNLAEHVARDGHRVMIFSLEMDADEVMEKLVSSVGGIFYADVQSGACFDTETQRQAIAQTETIIPQMDLLIDDRGSQTIHNIRAEARRAHIKKPLDLIVVDYLQLIGGDGKQSIYERITEQTRLFKTLAKDLNCAIVLLSQLNRQCDERPKGQNRPRMADLRDSGSIEQDADVVAFVYRDVVYSQGVDDYVAEIITSKCRKGVPGTDCLRSDLAHSRFVHQPGLRPQYKTSTARNEFYQ